MIPIWIFTGLASIILAITAAFFSITGLGILYSGAFLSVIIMGASIEFGKVITTFWLHQNYKTSSIFLVMPLLLIVLLSMIITSGGVYGYLSKGHLDQENPINAQNIQIEYIDNQIQQNKNKIISETKKITQLDNVIQTLIDYDKISGPTGANEVRRSQEDERTLIQSIIDDSQERITELETKKLSLESTLTQMEAKLGPVKYISMLFSSDTTNTILYFTLLIVLLLDPFAILLVIATSTSYMKWKEQHNKLEGIDNELTDLNNKTEIPCDKNIESERNNIVTFENDLMNFSDKEIEELLEDPEIQDQLLSDPELLDSIEQFLEQKKSKSYKYGSTTLDE